MIRFFRTIRQRLLRDNRFTKYLLYAIGEIILVVIGILIALQINTWNDFRKERKNERLILNNFKDNLDKDKQLLQQFQKGTELGIKAVDTTLLMINGHLPFDFRSFSNSIEGILSNKYFQTTSTTFDQAISTGKIDLILDDELRSQLLNYYKLTKLNFEDNQVLETSNTFAFPTIFSMIIPTKSISYAISGIETKLPELDLKSLGSNQEFNTWIIFKRIAFQRQSANYLALQNQVDKLTDMIESQLND